MSGIVLNACKAYDDKTVFSHLRLDISHGEILCVLGASGAGKTTLLNMLAGLTPFDGRMQGLPQRVAYAFQEPRLLENLTVEKNLSYAGVRVERVDEVLEDLEIGDCKRKRPAQLSGGEKQRVNFARAVASGAELLLLDEPFSSLDIALKARLMRAFVQTQKVEKQTVVWVTHDLEEAWAVSDRIIVLKDGEIVYDLRPEREKTGVYGAFDKQKQELISSLIAEK